MIDVVEEHQRSAGLLLRLQELRVLVGLSFAPFRFLSQHTTFLLLIVTDTSNYIATNRCCTITTATSLFEKSIKYLAGADRNGKRSCELYLL